MNLKNQDIISGLSTPTAIDGVLFLSEEGGTGIDSSISSSIYLSVGFLELKYDRTGTRQLKRSQPKPSTAMIEKSEITKINRKFLRIFFYSLKGFFAFSSSSNKPLSS